MLTTAIRRTIAVLAIYAVSAVSSPAFAVEAPTELLGTWGPVLDGFDAKNALCDHEARLEIWVRNTKASSAIGALLSGDDAMYIEWPGRVAAVRVFDVEPIENGWKLYMKSPNAPENLESRTFTVSGENFIETDLTRPYKFGKCS